MRIMNEEKLQMMLMFIKQYARDNNGAAPSLTTIMENLKMAKSTTYRYILELEKRGVISYKGKRTLESSQQRKMKCNCCRIPLVGKIICGSPDVQEEHIDSYMALPEEWLDGDCFLLEAYGDSMIDIGIDEGDLILVKKTEFPTDGDVVVSEHCEDLEYLNKSESTLKKYADNIDNKCDSIILDLY